ncbi:hypothetical protein BLNAU_20427 [Blattamonas nauphoetae]|uniref:Uncharacterized protein n=1 Tax=Blattamonas nauphoetae TaxID=2049346 RepID=A0ABQ9WZ93_9EUKA|nr:hypothetical protein BLNAU_20427 [Blattamonas nauphoetae]
MTLTMGGWTRDLAGRTQQRKLLAVRAQETEEEITQRVNEQRKQLQACHNKTLEKKYHNELLEASQKLDNTNEKGYMQLVPLTQLENEKTQKASAKIERKLKIGKKMNQEAAILLQVLEGYMTNTFSHPYPQQEEKRVGPDLARQDQARERAEKKGMNRRQNIGQGRTWRRGRHRTGHTC